MSDGRARRALAFFLPAAIALTVICVLLAVALQQVLRTGADDPQTQQAEDLAQALDGGAAPASLVGGTRVDVGTSLGVLVAIYDQSGVLLATNGTIDGALPLPPPGVLDTAAHSRGINKVTWNPNGTRIATVVASWRGGTVLAGRSLRVVEERTGQLQALVTTGWLAGIFLIAVAATLAGRLVRRW